MEKPLRLATYNVEWFNALFDDAGRLLRDGARSERHDVSREAQISALGTVFTALDADAVMIIEAPDTQRKRSTVKALERFAAHFDLRARKAIIGYASDTEQEIALLFDPARLGVRHDPKGAPSDKRGQADNGGQENQDERKIRLQEDLHNTIREAVVLSGRHARVLTHGSPPARASTEDG